MTERDAAGVPSESRHESTCVMFSFWYRSFAEKQSALGMPMAWHPLRNMPMLPICLKANEPLLIFFTEPGLILLISSHSST